MKCESPITIHSKLRPMFKQVFVDRQMDRPKDMSSNLRLQQNFRLRPGDMLIYRGDDWSLFLLLFTIPIDTWILYRGHDYGVSSIVRDAYRKYSDSEFGSQSSGKDISNLQRHVKLISIAGKRAIVSIYTGILHEWFSYGHLMQTRENALTS